ncbi:PEP-CTERM sorting domain-containing protein [Desulfopila aestuarii]|uniref:PEP-CTERM protein-sorting domain-containing protein n=1 Tax=Desulfopila aestuarii DSM 18488 TaxID=1121416 RepID=A0A1M7Y598_9BACT|nr:PEP-CTERM sorting domain-containing protein [Desulfopila aestuarii]SHO47533.1 PEP-CTERM protein-sorting domain-containing protein [Desulfopila aestuarii DSM 18488]
MKKSILIAVLGLSLGFVSVSVSQASLYVNDGAWIDVVSWDNFLTKTDDLGGTGSDPVDELKWLNNWLNTSGYIAEDFLMSDYTKFDPVVDLEVYSTSGDLSSKIDNSVAFALVDQPKYFFVKTGTTDESKGSNWFLFNNNINLDYAVFQLSGDGYYIKNVGKLSHAGQVGGGDTAVPEPATMLLFGTGLASLAAYRRKKN